MKKSERQQVIRELLARNEIQTQEQLEALLEVEGVRTAQATLSRDLRELGAVKGTEGYRIVDDGGRGLALPEPVRTAVRDDVRTARAGGGLVVLKTRSGGAATVARTLDAASIPHVLGTIAGEDTVFIATGSHGRALELLWLIRRAVG